MARSPRTPPLSPSRARFSPKRQCDSYRPWPRRPKRRRGCRWGLPTNCFYRSQSPRSSRRRAAFSDARSETGVYHVRPFGRPQIEGYFGGRLAAALEAGGAPAFADFATSELVGLLGSNFAQRVRPLKLHPWGADPFSRGSYSYALPGKADCRADLAAPVDDRLFFAGEACSKSDYSTAHGAYLTGIAAAERVIAARGRKR